MIFSFQVCISLTGSLCSHVTRMLLKNSSCDPNLADIHGSTALMYACKDKDKNDAVRILARNHQCDTNRADEKGNTALIHAVVNDNTEAVHILLVCPRVRCKVDVNIQNMAGRTALDMAIERRNVTCCHLLVKRAEADISRVQDTGKLYALLSKDIPSSVNLNTYQ